MAWQLQEAKNRFSEVVKRAQSEGPQMVTLRGVDTAVVLSAKEYERLAPKKPSLAEFLMAGPAWPDDLVEEINRRDYTPDREIEL